MMGKGLGPTKAMRRADGAVMAASSSSKAWGPSAFTIAVLAAIRDIDIVWRTASDEAIAAYLIEQLEARKYNSGAQ